ncbi:MAG: heavy metal translocating P-type ATPase metal-binding domain-containing protein [Bacteroidota bacterium]|nr:heavy metal translocating P-type ATPase metal-binding domain-containing protein [Bacteroidota bacterium]
MANNEKIPCYHCGEDCGPNPVMYDDKPFCCYGCRTVYEILSESEACEYYNIENSPGIKINSQEIGNKYAYLDNEDIKRELYEFSDGGISKVKLFIPSIHCSSCIWLLENLHKLEKGFVNSSVHFVKKEITITFQDQVISLRKLVELLVSINYVPQITLDDLNKSSKSKANRKIYYKLGVAGFCFGNIMLFSFPEYLAVSNNIEDLIREKFSYLNLLFSLPVIFYAASDYLVSAYKGLKKKIINIDVPIALGIIVLFTRSAYEILSGYGPGYMDSLSGLVFFLLIGKWYQGKTYQALSFERDYKSYFPVAVTIINEDTQETTIPLKNLKAGNRIIVRNQELIPADSILVKGDANIDYSFVSGESTPVSKNLKDHIYAGGRQMGSSIELIVEKDVSQSYLTELWNQDMHAYGQDSRLSSLINVISQYFTISIIAISLAAGITWLFIDPAVAMNAFTSILIVACPCALALTIPFAFGSAMRIFGRKGFYLKKTDVIERLSKINTAVLDKTGTITQNDAFEIGTEDIKLSAADFLLVKSLVRHSTHPLSAAIYMSIPAGQILDVKQFSEIPALGIIGEIEGHTIKIGSEKFVTEKISESKTYTTKVYVSIDKQVMGFFTIKNKYRPGLKTVMQDLGADFEMHLLSGDNDSELPNLEPLFKHREYLNFKQSPADKLRYVEALKAQGKVVLMIGDGLNDAGALQESDVGITIADDIYHFSPACDAILNANKFEQLSKYIKFSRTSMNIVKVSFAISFLYNIVGISFAAMGLLTPIISAILMPLSSVSVVAFVTFATIVMARRKIFK